MKHKDGCCPIDDDPELSLVFISIVFLDKINYHERAMLQVQNPKLNMQSRSYQLKVILALVVAVPCSLISIPFAQSASAETSSNYNYSIDVDTIDTNPPPPRKVIRQILGSDTSSLPSQFRSGTNFTVTNSEESIAFRNSQNTIDLGILSGTNPVIRTSQLWLTSSGQVLTYENQPLTSQAKSTIPDSTCDDGSCSEKIGSAWLSSLTYGFGYRCDSDLQSVCEGQFRTSNLYKQYPDVTRNELPQPIMSARKPDQTVSSTLTYKVTISATQKQEGYYNTVTYLAIPSF